MNVFTKDNILLNQKLDSKEAAIDMAGEILVKQGYVDPDYIGCMHAREKVISTYIGCNVGIPHGIDGSEVYIKESGISFIQVPDGVMYGEEPAYIILGIAGKDGTHLDILMQLSEILLEDGTIEALRYAKTKEEVMNILAKIEI